MAVRVDASQKGLVEKGEIMTEFTELIVPVLVKLAVVAAVLALIIIVPLLVFAIGFVYFNLIESILDWFFNLI